MAMKQKILFFTLCYHFLYGIISGFSENIIKNNTIAAIFGTSVLILFFIWLYYDSIDYKYDISKLFLLLLGIFYFIYYIFKTRKLKKGFIFILKSSGFIILLFLVFSIPYLIIVYLRGNIFRII